MDISEEGEDRKDNDSKSPTGSDMDTGEKEDKASEKVMQKATIIKIKIEKAGGAANQSSPSTSELAAKLSETITNKDRERFDRDARLGQLTGERIMERPRATGGKGSLGFQTVAKSPTASTEAINKVKWDTANIREGKKRPKGLTTYLCSGWQH